jgi:predicted signal transduction protein with EAL and GGDEF domain
VLCWRCDAEDDLDQRLTVLRAAMLRPVEVHGRRVDVALAIGFAAGDTSEPDRLIANAAFAAMRAKAAGAAWHMHDVGDELEVGRELSLLGELDEAIEREQIEVFYQTKLDIASGRIAGVEALVRWHHPKHGFMSPLQFVPLAERNDRIAPLTLHVINRALAHQREWRAAGHRIPTAVNVSAKLLDSEGFIVELRHLLLRSRSSPAA